MEMDLGFDPVAVLRMPLLQKIGIGLLLLALVGGGYWHLWLQDRLASQKNLNDQIQKQEIQIRVKRRLLAQLPTLRAELELIRKKEILARRELPSKREIPSLLTDVSNIIRRQGLESILFAPQGEEEANFFAAVPVNLRLQGGFHDLMLFLDQIAGMSRIVSISNIKLSQAEGNKRGLGITALATTYRFLQEEEDEEETAP